jgi:hypothetical protein
VRENAPFIGLYFKSPFIGTVNRVARFDGFLPIGYLFTLVRLCYISTYVAKFVPIPFFSFSTHKNKNVLSLLITHNSIAVFSLKSYTMAGFEPGSSVLEMATAPRHQGLDGPFSILNGGSVRLSYVNVLRIQRSKNDLCGERGRKPTTGRHV